MSQVSAPGPDICVRKVSVNHDEALGAYHFDLQLFDHFASKFGGGQVNQTPQVLRTLEVGVIITH